MGLLFDSPLPDDCEIFTTGQMIDTLEYGYIAEALTGFYEGSKLLRNVQNEFTWLDSIGDFDKRFTMTAFALKTKWKIYKNPLMTERVCENCKYIEMYGDTCPASDDDTEHLDNGLMISCKCFEGFDANE